MYSILLPLHSSFRWLVLISLLSSIYISWRGYNYNKPFGASENSLRHWTATILHVQLMIGMLLYFQSPVVKFSSGHNVQALFSPQVFFKYIHLALMILATVLVTIGSAKAKRMDTAAKKYKTMLVWFIIALLVIFVAIPWPFSPLATRPFTRAF